MKCLELLELLEYRESAVDAERMEQTKKFVLNGCTPGEKGLPSLPFKTKKHLEECQTCREKYEGLEQLATALKTYFRSQPKVKGEYCPDESVWEKYVKKQMKPQDSSALKEHLAECDYCFDIAAKLFKAQLDVEAVANVQTPPWLKERVEKTAPGSRMSNVHPLLRWLQALRNLFASRLVVAYAAAVILLFAFFIARPYILHKGVDMASTSNQLIQIGQKSYVVFNLGSKVSPNLKTTDEMPQLPLAALLRSQHARQMLAFLSVQFVDALKGFLESTDLPVRKERTQTGAEHLNRILTELETQGIKPPTGEIEFVIIETSLRSQIQNETYKREQHLLVSFPEETILKIQNVQ